jgi:cAMP phosphodiesterase
MQLRVLGCHGGELPRHRTTCFLVDSVLALDAGALCQTLSLAELDRVENIVVTHSHFDHIKDLPLLADLLVGRRDKPVTIHASTECAQTLKDHVFNNQLWPDFTRIPNAKNPVYRIKPFKPGATLKIGAYTVKSVPVSHPVESCGFTVSAGQSALGMSGDTGPSDGLWKLFNKTKGLKAILLEASFPNALQGLANLSGHLTPQTVASELAKLKDPEVKVLLYHLKPAFIPQLKLELRASAPQAHVTELDEIFEF